MDQSPGTEPVNVSSESDAHQCQSRCVGREVWRRRLAMRASHSDNVVKKTTAPTLGGPVSVLRAIPSHKLQVRQRPSHG